jgi:argininosuccinate lyase
VSARTAHAAIGNAVARADAQERPLEPADLAEIAAEAGLAGTLAAPLDARASIHAKRTHGSTHPAEVRAAIEGLERELDAL